MALRPRLSPGVPLSRDAATELEGWYWNCQAESRDNSASVRITPAGGLLGRQRSRGAGSSPLLAYPSH